MLIDAEALHNNAIVRADVAVVGAGPAGIVLALELAQAGYEVALIESGRLGFSKPIQTLSEVSAFDPQCHAPMAECTRRQVGGASTIWGGRCVPYDPVDFDQRDYIPDSAWPVTYEELTPYFQRACDYFLCGQAEFNLHQIPSIAQKSIVPGLPDGHVLTSTLERWSLPTNFGQEYGPALKRSRRIKLLYGLTCTEIETHEQGTQVQALVGKTLNGKTVRVQGQQYVLAGGALNTTRLLLASDRRHPGGIGNHSGLLGRFYMGHLSGEIATVQFTTTPQKTVFKFDRDPDGVYLRRRFSFSREFLHDQKLANIVAWLGVPQFADPSHRNGILSLAHLALNSPVLGRYLRTKVPRELGFHDTKTSPWTHGTNILKDLGNTLTFVPGFAYQRFLARRKIPALFVYSGANEYPLHYHSEQQPNPNSRVSLSDERDILGLRKLVIDLRCTPQDIDTVVRAHRYWDDHLRRYGCGQLKFLTDDLEARVLAQFRDGFHQVGTTRMAARPGEGVVDGDCRVHGMDNLFVASSSIFVTSGQANSTFMIIVLALRLSIHLDKKTTKITKPCP